VSQHRKPIDDQYRINNCLNCQQAGWS